MVKGVVVPLGPRRVVPVCSVLVRGLLGSVVLTEGLNSNFFIAKVGEVRLFIPL